LFTWVRKRRKAPLKLKTEGRAEESRNSASSVQEEGRGDSNLQTLKSKNRIIQVGEKRGRNKAIPEKNGRGRLLQGVKQTVERKRLLRTGKRKASSIARLCTGRGREKGEG